jgi:hypothetical protein
MPVGVSANADDESGFFIASAKTRCQQKNPRSVISKRQSAPRFFVASERVTRNRSIAQPLNQRS